jgi:hypothetical protein
VSDDLTLLFDDQANHTLMTLTDSNDSIVGTIDILGSSFNSASDVTRLSVQESIAIDDPTYIDPLDS